MGDGGGRRPLGEVLTKLRDTVAALPAPGGVEGGPTWPTSWTPDQVVNRLRGCALKVRGNPGAEQVYAVVAADAKFDVQSGIEVMPMIAARRAQPMTWFDENVVEISAPVLHTPPGDANAWGVVHQLGYEEVRISPDEEAGALVFMAHYRSAAERRRMQPVAVFSMLPGVSWTPWIGKGGGGGGEQETRGMAKLWEAMDGTSNAAGGGGVSSLDARSFATREVMGLLGSSLDGKGEGLDHLATVAAAVVERPAAASRVGEGRRTGARMLVRAEPGAEACASVQFARWSRWVFTELCW
jgi:hypothetical protein